MSLRSWIINFQSRVVNLLQLPADTTESLLYKKRFLLSILPTPFYMTLYGGMFWLFGSQSLAVGMWLFGFVSALTLLAITTFPRNLHWIVVFYHYFFLIFSFLAVLYYGGILYSGGVVFVGLVGALSAMMFLEQYHYRLLLYLYFISVVLEGILQPFLTPREDITPAINLLSYVLHILVIGISVNKTLSYYISQTVKAKQLEANRLREIDAMKSRFYINISHEFRTPITIILGAAEQLAEKTKLYSQTGLQLIRRNGKQLLNLVNSILDLSKLETGHMSLHPIQTDIIRFLCYLAEPYENSASEKNIGWHFHCDTNKLIMDFDPDRIQSLIGNLLSNAIKHSPNGADIFLQVGIANDIPSSSKRDIFIFPNKRPPENSRYCTVHIKDTGMGIPKDQITHIFDRYYQISNQDTNPLGFGIGLSLVKELIDLMEGTLMVESTVDQGTSFWIYLPIKNEAPVSELTLEQDLEEPWYRIENHKAKVVGKKGLPLLLIAEDNPDVILYLRELLETHYQLILAGTGKEGISKALESIPDIILSDVMMPEKDGFELCKVLKNDFRTSHIPIILLTARADMSSKLEGLEIGADDYLTKPFSKKELLARLQSLIAIRKKLHERYKSGNIHETQQDSALQKEDEFIHKINELVEKNMNSDGFGVPELCYELAISRAQLYRKFEALTNSSIGKHIRLLRLRKAKELMENDGLNVTEAAFEVGFNSLSHFSVAFKKEFGLSPSQLVH